MILNALLANAEHGDEITRAILNSASGVPNTNSWSLDALGNWTSGNGTN